ncbi:MAG: hypothetical protein M3408_03595 [Actinomycetota bacterium]|nr:hypothetical protein [Actinomycetota bacterium]
MSELVGGIGPSRCCAFAAFPRLSGRGIPTPTNMINHPDEHDRARRDHEADTLPQINFPDTSSLVGRCLTRAG